MSLRQKLAEKAKTKKDGVFTSNGSFYRVKSGKLTHYSQGNQIIQAFAMFDLVIGQFAWSHEARNFLKSLED
jgi:hypothetical protein